MANSQQATRMAAAVAAAVFIGLAGGCGGGANRAATDGGVNTGLASLSKGGAPKSPAPARPPEPAPAPRPSAAPVTYPAYHATVRQRPSRGGQSPVTYVLLVTVPALIAVAALRPR